MITEEQRLARKNGLGGSDAAAVMGVSDWKSPVELFFEKTSVQEGKPINPESAFFGNQFEDVIAQYYTLKTGNKARRKNKTVVSKKYPWMLANLDFAVSGKKILLECKTASAFDYKSWGEEGTDQIPMSYLCQVLHYMIVTEYHEAHVAVLFGINDLRIFKVQYNEVMANRLIEAERKFWFEHVLKKIPPAPTITSDCDLVFPMANGQSKIATAAIEQTALELLKKKRAMSALEKEIDTLELPIKQYMEAAEFLTSSGGIKLVQWDTSSVTKLATSKLKTDMPELYNQFCETKTQRNFRAAARMSEKNFTALEAAVARNSKLAKQSAPIATAAAMNIATIDSTVATPSLEVTPSHLISNGVKTDAVPSLMF
jgi:putative phage-type endonuclease